MRIVRRFAELPVLEQRLVVKAWFAVSAVRVLLWVVPYRLIDAWLLQKAPAVGRAPVPPDLIARAVTRASTLVPAATCLVQALAGGWLIRRAGGRSTIRFGVARGDAGFKAHAWLESGGRILIGGGTAGDYLPLARADDVPR